MRLHVEDSGSGDPVVLLHSHGLSGGQWRKLIGSLGAHRVLAVDLTGQGKSEPWPEREPFTFQRDVDSVVDILRTLPPAHVVGHSYGGLIALHAARVVPSRTLSLFDPVAFSVLDSRVDLPALDPSWDTERWLRAFVEFWGGSGAWDALREEARAEFRRVAWVIREGVRTLVADRTAFALDVPTLLLTGELSPAPARRVVERLAQQMPRARLEVVPGVGHLGPVTHARDVNPHILARLSR